MLRWFNHSVQITAHVVQTSMQINNIGIYEDRHYISMEYLEGDHHQSQLLGIVFCVR